MKTMHLIRHHFCPGGSLRVYGYTRPDPVLWEATVNSSGGFVSFGLAASSPPPTWRRVLASRGFRFVAFLAIVVSVTALLTMSSHALFNVILALGVASVVSVSWKFSA